MKTIDREIEAQIKERQPLDKFVAEFGLRWTIDRLAAITFEKGLDSRGQKRERFDRASIKLAEALRELKAGDR